MKELNTANHLLGDRQALDRAWERDGYWFFRDVLPAEALAPVRRDYIESLQELGFIDANVSEAIHNGADLSRYPIKIERLTKNAAWKSVAGHPQVAQLMRQLLNDEPFWIPTVEYRASPPKADRTRSRFDFIHQDGFYNRGIPFRVCWIPLTHIDATTGGLAVAEGLHRGPWLHALDQPPNFLVPDGAVADEAWRRSDYRPGDLLVFDINTPHSGLANYCDRRFRLSMDIRVMPASGNTPAVGTIDDIDEHAIRVRTSDGKLRTSTLDEETYARGLDGLKLPHEQILRHFKRGDPIMVSSELGRAKLVRPPH
jgi:ectoine hydroxylase-related dioxygenase (phytanoyl-CoA dioxygenase family)